jgi:hypothetical protein
MLHNINIYKNGVFLKGGTRIHNGVFLRGGTRIHNGRWERNYRKKIKKKEYKEVKRERDERKRPKCKMKERDQNGLQNVK